MELLILLLLSPAVFAQRREKSNDPNDEPFLPIYPVYPYDPKLMKRGTEKEVAATHLTPELYAPKLDARDSYTTSFGQNYQRDPYFPAYSPYPKTGAAGLATSSGLPATAGYGASLYNVNAYTYPNVPYNLYNSYTSPYSMTPHLSPSSSYTNSAYSNAPYTSGLYSAAAYPNYYNQPHFYYPNYYNHPYMPPPPPPPGYTDSSKDSESDERAEKDSQKTRKEPKSSDNDSSQDSGNQFVDGGNYISGSSKDLDVQSSTYKAASPYNQLEQLVDQLKHLPLPLPKTTYRVVSVAGQPVGPDYPLPPAYIKAQQLEQLMSQTLSKLLAQNTQQQVTQYPVYETNQNIVTRSNDAPYNNQNNYNKQIQQNYMPIAKTGLGYTINPTTLGKINIAQINPAPVTTTLIKPPKPVTRLALQESSGLYGPSKAKKTQTSAESSDYDSYDSQSNDDQNYEGQAGGKQEQQQTYGNDQTQSTLAYRNPNYVTVQTPNAYSYQYSSYNPSQTTTQQQSQQQYKTNLDDVNFGSKNNNKG